MEKTKIQTIDIKGKKYATVDSRVEFFREKFPTYSIETSYPFLDMEHGVCVCRAVVKDDAGKIVADGFAHEWQNKPGSMVNKTSYIENAQTSAVGRALGFMGIGINGVGIATADEVQTAITHQENNDLPPVIDDEIPFSEPDSVVVVKNAKTPKQASADDWLPVNAFRGLAERTTTVAELQKLLNGQRGNPHLQELAEIASARKIEILQDIETQANMEA